MTILAKSSGTMRRLLGAMLLIPVVGLVWYDQKIAGLVVLCLGILMGFETKRILALPAPIGLIVLAVISVLTTPQWLLSLSPLLMLSLAGLGAIVVGVYVSQLAAMFVGWLCLCLASASLLLSQPLGHVILLALAGVIAACDSAAYFVGRRVGGPKLWPRVSPNKTISGSLGGLFAAMLGTMLFSTVLGFAGAGEAIFFGLVIGVLSQAGDLLESAVKRSLNVKDSGSILPGHGGLLDRFDGYVFVFPAAYLYLFVI